MEGDKGECWRREHFAEQGRENHRKLIVTPVEGRAIVHCGIITRTRNYHVVTSTGYY